MTATGVVRGSVIGAVSVGVAAVVMGTGGSDGSPRSIAALGDSHSAGFSATGHNGSELANSWATGTNPKVRSIYFRLRQKNGPGERAFNVAEPGSTMSLLSYEAGLIPKGVDLVTVEMGTNDVCDPPATSAAVFGSQLAEGLRVITTRAPAARIVVLSIFDHPRVWDAVKTVPGVRRTRSFCFAATTASGRQAVRKATRILNHELASVCGSHPHCRYDGGAAFRIRWTRADVSTIDYFHPSLAGQRKIADAIWASGAVTRN